MVTAYCYSVVHVKNSGIKCQKIRIFEKKIFGRRLCFNTYLWTGNYPSRPLSFLVEHGWKPIKKVVRYNVGYVLFRKFNSVHVVHNRIYTVWSFFFLFEALIFLVMLRNVTTLHCSGCSGRKVFQLCHATTVGFLRRLPQTPVSISCISHPWPGSLKKWTWLCHLTVGFSAGHFWTKYRASGFHKGPRKYRPAALVNVRE